MKHLPFLRLNKLVTLATASLIGGMTVFSNITKKINKNKSTKHSMQCAKRSEERPGRRHLQNTRSGNLVPMGKNFQLKRLLRSSKTIKLSKIPNRNLLASPGGEGRVALRDQLRPRFII
ncbi:hypothetical protein CEXT_473471 [Caerostris extrusa]|uniref:Uncharacterized protein n=1 Tax=Caerostris extrusa TaxID=172846 RepID=A0AAV4V497_CAEEX|nr:hypothetical protein CEXT_473471 [Caerostris extrusa]